MRLRVYTRERQLVDQDVREVTAPGAYGEIGVLPDHAALVTTLEITGGFAEVRDNVMTVLADAGEDIVR